MRIPSLWVGALTALPLWAMAATPWATATIVEGEVHLVREAVNHTLTEGTRLTREDILHTGPASRLVRVEFADGVIFDLGPETRLLLAPPARARGKTMARAYLLGGLVKVGLPAGTAAEDPLVVSPLFELASVSRGVVLKVAPNEAALFAESGEASLAERRDGQAQARMTVKNGQFYQRLGDGRAQVSGRPAPAFIQALPRAFLDTLPSRLGRWSARESAPRRIGTLAYDDARPWLDAEPALRAAFVSRWKGLAKDPAFRAGLLADMSAHPEWDRVLFPEKYRPKPPAAPSAAASR